MRVILLVVDGLGCGAAPDAAEYGDEGSHTLANTARAVGGLSLPVLERLGLGVVDAILGVRPVAAHHAAVGLMVEQAAGKDSTSGHWELAGLIVTRPFPTYPRGFPPDVIAAVEAAIGRPVLGNEVASGTEIIARLGPEHLRTGYPIVYTSADSVFQVAAHESVVPVEQLYAWCRAVRRVLVGEHAVSRVIARPFTGAPGAWVRTPRRRDFSLAPVGPTVLDALTAAGLPVVGIGKVDDLFAGRGFTRTVHTRDDEEGIARTVEAAAALGHGLVFTNLIELDQVYGHRNDAAGYARHLQWLDDRLLAVLHTCGDDGLLIITADHGNDPTTPSTDHSRERVPLLAWRSGLPPGRRLCVRRTFADVAATVAAALGVTWTGPGTSFWPLLSGEGART